MIDGMIDGYALTLLEKLCEAVEKLNEGLSQRVVAAWAGKCPECLLEDGAIFIVQADQRISVRCLFSGGCCKPRQVLVDDNTWVEADAYGNVYE